MARVALTWMLVAFLVLVCLHLAGGEEARIEKRDLPGIPEDVRLGMSVKDLMKMRPKAEPFDMNLGDKPRPRPADLGKGSHLLMEKIEGGGILSGATAYMFQDGRCVAVSREDVYLREEAMRQSRLLGIGVGYVDFVKKRAETLRHLVTLLGTDYERHLVRKSFNGGSYLAPVFLWKGKDRNVALTVPTEYQGVTFDKGNVHLIEWIPGEKYEPAFEKDEDPGLLAALFAPLEKDMAKGNIPSTSPSVPTPQTPKPEG